MFRHARPRSCTPSFVVYFTNWFFTSALFSLKNINQRSSREYRDLEIVTNLSRLHVSCSQQSLHRNVIFKNDDLTRDGQDDGKQKKRLRNFTDLSVQSIPVFNLMKSFVCDSQTTRKHGVPHERFQLRLVALRRCNGFVG